MALARYSSASFSTSSGVAVAANADVEVRRASDNGLANLFEDRDGLVPMNNPFQADAQGRFSFCVAGFAEGYNITVDDGVASHTLENVPIGIAAELDVSDFFASLMEVEDAAALLALLGALELPSETDAQEGDVLTLLGGRPYWTANPPLPRSYLAGFGLANNGTDATNDIDIAAGAARDSTNAANLVGSAMTKRLDAAWAAGTNQGGLDTGAIANTTYHVFAIRKDSDGSVDYLFSTSASAPTMPTGYTYFRRVGSILRAGATIVAFKQYGDYFRKQVATQDINVAQTTSSALRALAVPLGVKVRAIISLYVDTVNGAEAVYITDPDTTEQAPATQGPFTHEPGASVDSRSGQGEIYVYTDTSAQVRTDASANISNMRVYSYGWIDRRGRDD